VFFKNRLLTAAILGLFLQAVYEHCIKGKSSLASIEAGHLGTYAQKSCTWQALVKMFIANPKIIAKPL